MAKPLRVHEPVGKVSYLLVFARRPNWHSLCEVRVRGEQESAADDSKTKLAKEQKTLKDSALPVVMIGVLLVTFGALAATAIYVVSRAFGEGEDADQTLPVANASSP